ncbi:MAG: 23S rRNA (guanosine(2251)-2'-O)-methyltransferase RlmB [Anaerolineales bacterium]|nr:23S rRNA (guanosine(2251)-2'-O)-methyltransferase RlmB [Anaerolineales bacterium]
MREWIVGRNPIFEVLQAQKRQSYQLQVAKGAILKGRLAHIIQICESRKIPIRRVSNEKVDAKGHGHQGVAIEVNGYPYCTIYDILECIEEDVQPAFLLILDTLQDPQNLGTLLRTADVTGVQGVILPLRRSATVTPAVVRASSGATEHLNIAQANLAQTIVYLKQKGIWIIGLEHSPKAKKPQEIAFSIPLAFVVGSEGQGMRNLTRKSCDMFLRLPMRGHVDSLNASVAGSIALYLAWEQRNFEGESAVNIDGISES